MRQYFCKFYNMLLCIGQYSSLPVNKYDMKNMINITGNTSMDACLSLIMANMGKADSGKIIFDPFVGSGKIHFNTLYCIYIVPFSFYIIKCGDEHLRRSIFMFLTGSILVAAAHYGAYVAGSDIDYNLLHGIGMTLETEAYNITN